MPGVSCPRCGTPYSVSDDFVGRTVRCSKHGCSQTFIVPAQTNEFEEQRTVVPTSQESPVDSRQKTEESTEKKPDFESNDDVARILFLIGAIFTACFFFAPTNVGKIENIGLLANKICGCFVGGCMLMAGIFFYASSHRKIQSIDRLSILSFVIVVAIFSVFRSYMMTH